MSTDPRFPPCTPVGVPAGGTAVDTVVVLSRDGQDWVARSPGPPEGTIELRFRASAPSARGWTVTGSIAGTGIDVALNGVSRDVRVVLSGTSGGPATLEGETTSPQSPFVGGRAAGSIRFADSAGNTGSCQAVQWTLQPR